MADKKNKIIPPSLQPRKTTKKSIPGSLSPKPRKTREVVKEVEKVAHIKEKTNEKENKERFTLWLSEDAYRAFKIHTATRKGSASDYIEYLIRKDLNI